jgi:superfamily II DNA helicase RecQ
MRPTFVMQMKLQVYNEFKKKDSIIRLVFATEALGMGVDIPDIRRIIHLGPPYSVESKFSVLRVTNFSV